MRPSLLTKEVCPGQVMEAQNDKDLLQLRKCMCREFWIPQGIQVKATQVILHLAGGIRGA